jgi:hypothetical protein
MRDLGMPLMRRATRPRATRAWIPAPGVYLTDERALFRVLGDEIVDGRIVVELEDCAQLVTLLVTEPELGTLRPVHSPDELAITVMN